MAAPVVRAEDLDRATREEYGEDDVLTEEEAESRLLARHLFAPPTRLAPSGARAGLALAPVRRSLEAFLRMVDGPRAARAERAPVTVGAAELATTDGVRVYLPPALPADAGPAGTPDALLGVYRLMGLVQLGLLRHGIVAPDRARLAEIHGDAVLRASYLHLGARFVLRVWVAAWPGLDVEAARAHPYARRLRIGFAELDPREVHPLAAQLLDGPRGSPRLPGGAHARLVRTLDAVDALPGDLMGEALATRLLAEARALRETFREARAGAPPVPFAYGTLRPEWILADLARDTAAEEAWRAGPAPLRGLLARGGPASAPDVTPPTGLRARLLAKLRGPSVADAPAYGALRETATPRGEFAAGPAAGPPPRDDAAPAYDEFDVTTGAWRTEAVRVVEEDAPPGGTELWERIARAREGELRRVRARFAALRSESRWRHAQLEGNELDMGAVLTAVADRAAGNTPDPRIHARWERARPPMAVLVLADLSGSMAGDPLALQTEALVMVAEGLGTLGAPHAVYGFGNTDPARCVLQRIKGFEAPWDIAARKRLGGLRAAGASRLGAYVRHATALLLRRAEPRKLLLLLSDGHPEDRDGYRGARGERDTALAVAEARRRGVAVHCTSLDPRTEAERYLTAIFGRGHYLRVARPELLPERLTDAVFARVP